MYGLDLATLPDLDTINVQLARKKFINFVTYTWDKYQVNWHHAAIADKLDRFARGEIKFLMLFVPPQHGKSQLSSRHLPAYLLGLHPDKRVCIASYSDDLAGGFSKAAQRIIDSDEYQRVFPNTKIPKKGAQGEESRNADLVEVIGHRGSIKSVGVGNGITGNPVDIAIIDDPIKGRLDAESATYRERLWSWYTDELLTRLDNDSQILILLTRWHEDDLAGRILKQDEELFMETGDRQWTVISYPGVIETEADRTAPDDPRVPGEALWPGKHSYERIVKQKKNSMQTFNSLYQQRPSSPEGNIFKVNEIGVISWHEFQDVCQGRKPSWDFIVDGAYTDKTQNDPSALYSSTMVNNDTYVRKSLSVRLEFPELCEYLGKFVKLNGYTPRSTISVEPKASGLSIIQAMKRATKLNITKYKWPLCEGERLDNRDKVERANAVAPTVNSGRTFLIEDGSGWTKTFLEQLGSFPNATHDDEVDCFVMDISRRYFDQRGTRRIIKK